MASAHLHFAFGVSIPFIISLFYYKKKFIFIAPLIMTITGFIAFLPSLFNWNGFWTNIFFLNDLINHLFNRGQFIGYGLTVIMFTIIASLQALYLWRNKYA